MCLIQLSNQLKKPRHLYLELQFLTKIKQSLLICEKITDLCLILTVLNSSCASLLGIFFFKIKSSLDKKQEDTQDSRVYCIGKQSTLIPALCRFGILVHSVQSGALRACKRWPLCNRLGILCSWHGKMGEWESGMKSALFNFSLPGLTELLCWLPGNCNTWRHKCRECSE